MSITKTRKFVEKSGCGLIVSVVIGIVMLLGIVLYGQGSRPEDDPMLGKPVFTVGKFEVKPGNVEAMLEIAAASQGARYELLAPIQKAGLMAGTVESLIASARIYELAKMNGVQVDDKAIQAGITGELDMIASNIYGQLLQAKQIDEKTTLDDFKKNSPELQRMLGEVEVLLKKLNESEETRELLMARYSGQGLQDAERAKVKPTEADLKSMYDTYVVDGITLSAATGKLAEVQARGEQLAKDVKSKGYEAVANELKAKKESGVEVFDDRSLPRALATMIEDYKPLIGLKAGDLTGFVPTQTGGTIFKVVSIKTELPPDFEKNKEQIRAQYIDQTAGMALQKKVKDLEKQMPITWNDEGYKAIHEYANAERSREALLKVAANAKAAAEKSTTIGLQAAVLARYAAVEEVWQMALEKDKPALREDRAEAIAALLGITEDAGLRLELVDLYTELKQGDLAYEQLQAAAEINNGFEAREIAINQQIQGKLKKLVEGKLISADQEKAVNKELDRWKTEKAENDRLEAEQKAFEEEQAKRDREEAAKIEAEEKARAEAERKKAETEAKPKGN